MLRNIRCPSFFSAETEARRPPIQRKARAGASRHKSSVFAKRRDEESVSSSKSRNILPSDQTQWAEFSAQIAAQNNRGDHRCLFAFGSACEGILGRHGRDWLAIQRMIQALIYRLARM